MALTDLAATLRTHAKRIPELKVVTGFDGFVDEMITLVGERKSLAEFTRVETIADFGGLVTAAAGHSSLREIVITATHPGGCAVNMGDGLVALGPQVDTFATLGEPPHPAFADYAARARVRSWGREPGRTLAYEFADGKLMFSAVTQLAEFTPDALAQRIADGDYLATCEAAGLIALTNWTLYPHMTACWRFLQREIYAKLTHRPWFFVDLVDPASRAIADVRDMLGALRGFEPCGPTVLGLNQNEANIVTRALKLGIDDATTPDATTRQAVAIRAALGIHRVVVHAHKYAVSADARDSAHADGPYCVNPVKSTGAGDRFNAGYALALLLGLEAQDALLLGNATSGAFVRAGHSVPLDELIAFIERWANGAAL